MLTSNSYATVIAIIAGLFCGQQAFAGPAQDTAARVALALASAQCVVCQQVRAAAVAVATPLVAPARVETSQVVTTYGPQPNAGYPRVPALPVATVVPVRYSQPAPVLYYSTPQPVFYPQYQPQQVPVFCPSGQCPQR